MIVKVIPRTETQWLDRLTLLPIEYEHLLFNIKFCF